MDTAHLDAPPEVRANFPFDLADGEKVIFSAPLSSFGTEEDTFLGGSQSKLCLTNRRLVANNTVGLWTVDLADDVVGAELVKRGGFLSNAVVRVDLAQELVYGDAQDGQGTLRGFRFYLKPKDGARLMELMDAALA